MVEEKNSEWTRYLKVTAVSSLIVFLILVYPVYKYATWIQVNSFLCGYIISLINGLLGFKLNAMAFEKPVKGFMILVFGGMGLRIIVVMLLLLILLQFSIFESISLISSVFFFYILFISIEIYFLHKKQVSLKIIKQKNSE
jgi:hypothetical protein